MSGPDEPLVDDELMRILWGCAAGSADGLRALYTVDWKDGIDIERPSSIYKNLARCIAEAANAALAARCERAELDAERYRWLRDPQNADISGYAASLWGEYMDKAIDSSRALASQAEGER